MREGAWSVTQDRNMKVNFMVFEVQIVKIQGHARKVSVVLLGSCPIFEWTDDSLEATREVVRGRNCIFRETCRPLDFKKLRVCAQEFGTRIEARKDPVVYWWEKASMSRHLLHSQGDYRPTGGKAPKTKRAQGWSCHCVGCRLGCSHGTRCTVRQSG